ncbi:helix-turn-helix transcriptional regulator, partial [Streptomyces sp. T-3]|nr:helix-turn-helix transcriptional regulator [Streptomyces sp. T-3]
MTDFSALDALLASVSKEEPLPPAAERRSLRLEAGLSQAQLAQALGVNAKTLAGWESGREPSGEVRTKYAYLLDGLRAKLRPEPEAGEELDGAGTNAQGPEGGAPAGREPGAGEGERLR